MIPISSTTNTLPSSPSSTTTSLFGIKRFRPWFESQFPQAICELNDWKSASQKFDHVLVDVNQLLHVSVRKSRSESHGLVLFFRELDLLLKSASPIKSLVLAMDGPPGAAKLATQRKRRMSTLHKSQSRSLKLDLLSKFSTARKSKKRRRRQANEIKSLAITPGTKYMQSAHQAVLYWAWQRLSNYNSTLANVKIHISSSQVPGEGEVKLLDWIYDHCGKGDSVAVFGGDSDLVLEALVIPPSITHNVFVLVPDVHRVLSISVWEMTRALSQFLPQLPLSDIMRVRTDMVLLLVMNGNDYLPKLRGSSGFNHIVHTYLRVLHTFEGQHPFLVHPDSLQFNLEFCLAFFRKLKTPQDLADEAVRQTQDQRKRTLSHLQNLIGSGYVEGPVRFTPLQNASRLRLRLGQNNTYEIDSSKMAFDEAKRELAGMALKDVFGEELFSILTGITDDEDEEEDFWSESNETTRYPWELPVSAPANVTAYFSGLLWNLQTYQDGTSADYAYNYGRRLAPTAKQIVAFLREHANETLNADTLLHGHYTMPVQAEVSCLAAIPSQLHELLPEPYCCLAKDQIVEDYYGECMDNTTNVFDLKKFETLCLEWIQQYQQSNNTASTTDKKRRGKGRRILLGDHYWTVLYKSRKPLLHPFEPPEPFCDSFRTLKRNNRIRTSRIMCTRRPRPRNDNETVHGDIGLQWKGHESIESISYMKAYPGVKQKKKKKKLKVATFVLKEPPKTSNGARRKRRVPFDAVARMQQFKVVPPSPMIITNPEGYTAIQCLQQFVDVKMIEGMEWLYTRPSNSTYAAIDPEGHENISLKLVKGNEEDCVYEQDRHVDMVSKKVVKQHLASLALCELLGPQHQWTDMTFEEMRNTMTEEQNVAAKTWPSSE